MKFHLPSTGTTPAAVHACEPEDYLGISLAGRLYGLPLAQVLSIQRLAPQAQPGLYDAQRQQHVPVLDLRVLHAADRTDDAAAAPAVLILLETDAGRLAVLADAVTELVALEGPVPPSLASWLATSHDGSPCGLRMLDLGRAGCAHGRRSGIRIDLRAGGSRAAPAGGRGNHPFGEGRHDWRPQA